MLCGLRAVSQQHRTRANLLKYNRLHHLLCGVRSKSAQALDTANHASKDLGDCLRRTGRLSKQDKYSVSARQASCPRQTEFTTSACSFFYIGMQNLIPHPLYSFLHFSNSLSEGFPSVGYTLLYLASIGVAFSLR